MKKRNVSGMRYKWMRTSIIIVSALLLLVLTLFAVFCTSYYYNTVRSGLESKAKTAAGFFENYVTNSYNEYYNSVIRYAETFEDGDSLELQFIGTDGRVFKSTNSITAGGKPETADITRALETGTMQPYVGRSRTGERIISVSAPIVHSNGQVLGLMRYITSTKLIDRQILHSVLIATIIAVFVILIVISMNIVFVRSFIEPVNDITRMSKRISAGSYGIQIEKSYDDEIGEMVSSINEMSIKIAQSEKMQRWMLSIWKN